MAIPAWTRVPVALKYGSVMRHTKKLFAAGMQHLKTEHEINCKSESRAHQFESVETASTGPRSQECLDNKVSLRLVFA